MLLRPADRDALKTRWREPHRHYHTMQHLDECLARFASVRGEAARPDEVEAALWLHDAVYDPRAADNEERSAALAAELLAANHCDGETIARVRAMILATQHVAAAATGDAALVCDIDLAILGADRARFDEYARQIREEYAWVPAPIYRDRRADILRGFLARPQLFVTASLRAQLEAPARANLARAIARLHEGIESN